MKIKLAIILHFLIFTFASPKSVNNYPESAILLVNGYIFDVHNGKYITGHDLVIIDDKIVEIVSHDKISRQNFSSIIDLEGKYIIPGLIDSHVHLTSMPNENCLEIALLKGVTTVRDMGGDGKYLLDLQNAILTEEIVGPDIYFSAVMGGERFISKDSRVKVSTPPEYELGEAPWARLVTHNSIIAEIIDDAIKCGATGIKIYQDLDKEIIKKLSECAKEKGIKVWGHGFVYPANFYDTITSGVEVVSHANSIVLKDSWTPESRNSIDIDTTLIKTQKIVEYFEIMKTRSIYYDPTLKIMEYLFKTYKNQEDIHQTSNYIYKALNMAYNYGVKFVAGTDYPLPSKKSELFPLHEEIIFLVEKAGFKPSDAIISATLHGAEILGISDSIGSIENCKTANLVILKDDPLTDIRNISSIDFVIKNGIIYK
ncbi:MAG: amidohydrolase family protein [Candidatus Delongbacteria bacterium]|nr:amidohydrolase family protein [Candidatus Delongbacteria bacterium]